MYIVDAVQGFVAKLLLWPLDVVDYMVDSTFAEPDTKRFRMGFGCAMIVWYSFFIYSVVSLLECLI